jgi:ATP-binding cassette subfamily C protein LapB
MRISEGGEGLSGGQTQLVALTRLLLASPDVWLLDEPTSSMDDATEVKCLNALQEATKQGRTLVLVTHKMRLINLVNRVVVLTPQGVAMDGPKDAVLKRLREGAASGANSAQPAGAAQSSGPSKVMVVSPSVKAGGNAEKAEVREHV